MKRRKRLIITGDSPIKLKKIQTQKTAPMHDDQFIDMEQFEVKLFLQSSCYTYIDEAIKVYSKLIKREDNHEKFDIESPNGQQL